MSKRVNFGLIGCGEIATYTSQAILESQHARVVHCMDTNAAMVEDLAKRHGAKHTTKVEELLADKDVQAVVISTPHYLHEPLAIQAAQAGKHVLSEKPIACTLAQADAMIAAADQASVKLGVLFPARMNWSFVKAGELIRAGAIGEVIAVKLNQMGNKPARYWTGGWTGRIQTDWRTSLAKAGGGFLIMNLIHELDALIGMLDLKPARVYAEYANFRTPSVEVEDFISFLLRTQDNKLVTLDGSSAAVGGESFGIRMYGQKGQLVAGETLRAYVEEESSGLAAGKWQELTTPDSYPKNVRAMTVDAFAAWVLGQASFGPTGKEARRVLEIIRGAYLSMKRGGPVTFPVKE
jgi:predicted dehydrogenase